MPKLSKPIKNSRAHEALDGLISEVEELLSTGILTDECDLAKSLKSFKRGLAHEPCPVCSCNVHGRVTVALNHLHRGKITKAKDELLALLNLTKP